ncbi:hypothetical protein HOD30_00130 [Candidatus Peregrinibacteria bacterium]|nr:hypothetical protein [Candidatus Peregrinibacteria bacterium]MBT4632329.1 hypothetical protein [Candidatus Peregrinibacteria bacterium]
MKLRLVYLRLSTLARFNALKICELDNQTATIHFDPTSQQAVFLYRRSGVVPFVPPHLDD